MKTGTTISSWLDSHQICVIYSQLNHFSIVDAYSDHELGLETPYYYDLMITQDDKELNRDHLSSPSLEPTRKKMFNRNKISRDILFLLFPLN